MRCTRYAMRAIDIPVIESAAPASAKRAAIGTSDSMMKMKDAADKKTVSKEREKRLRRKRCQLRQGFTCMRPELRQGGSGGIHH